MASRQMRAFLAQWSEFRIEAVDFVQAGDSVVVTERQFGRGQASGIETEMTFYAVWTFRDGLATRRRWETDRTAAFSAATEPGAR